MVIKADRKGKNIYQQLLDRVYDPNDSFSMKDYREVEIEWIPFDFTGYDAIKEETKKWINILFTEDTKDRKGNWMLRGHTYHEMQEMEKLNMHYGDNASAYSFYGYNDEEYLLYTYTEGDTTLTILPDKDTYEKEKQETIDWYKENVA